MKGSSACRLQQVNRVFVWFTVSLTHCEEPKWQQVGWGAPSSNTAHVTQTLVAAAGAAGASPTLYVVLFQVYPLQHGDEIGSALACSILCPSQDISSRQGDWNALLLQQPKKNRAQTRASRVCLRYELANICQSHIQKMQHEYTAHKRPLNPDDWFRPSYHWWGQDQFNFKLTWMGDGFSHPISKMPMSSSLFRQ